MNEQPYRVTFTAAALEGIKAWHGETDIAALTHARTILQRNPRAGALQSDGLYRLSVDVGGDPQRVSVLYRYGDEDLADDEVRVVWAFAGP